MSETLADAMPKEIARVSRLRDEYVALRGMPQVSVEIQIAMLDAVINEAVTASAAGDVVAMVRAFAELKEWSE